MADGAPVFPDAVRAPVRKRTSAVLSLSSNKNQPVFFPDLKDGCAENIQNVDKIAK